MRLSSVLLVVLSAWSSPLPAWQCPDGSPPPCPGDRPALRRSTVAILPFESRSRDTGDSYLAEGLAEETGSRLGRIPRLAVTSQAAVRRVRNSAALSLSGLGRALGASYLVSGTVQQSGRRLLVTAELARAGTGERLWSERYDRAATELLSITADIASGVATGILGALPADERARLATPPTSNSAAYDLYLRGSRRLYEVDPTALQDAIASFEAALQLDPAFAAAHGRLAEAYSRAISFDVPLPGMPAESVVSHGLAEANAALASDSTSADAWGGRGVMLLYGSDPDYAGSLAALRRATLLDSLNAPLLEFYGTALRRLGDFETADHQYRRALALQPDLSQVYLDLAIIAFTRRQFFRAIALLDSAVAINPAHWVYHRVRENIHVVMGDTANARRDADAVERTTPDALRSSSDASALLRAAVGDTIRARVMLDSLVAALPLAGPLPVRRQSLVATLIQAAQIERALDLLERIRPRGAWLWSYLIMPHFDPVRSHPRFVRVLDEARPPGAPRMP